MTILINTYPSLPLFRRDHKLSMRSPSTSSSIYENKEIKAHSPIPPSKRDFMLPKKDMAEIIT